MHTIQLRGPTAAEHVRAALSKSLLSDESSARRLGRAHTTVRITVESSGDPGVALVLDGPHPEIGDNDDECAIQIVLGAEQALAFAAGALPLTAAIASGAVRATGPVRQYLEVDVILRELLAWHRDDSVAPCQMTYGSIRPGGLDPSMVALETRGLRKSFGAHEVLTGLDIQIPAGVISVVLGPSGTGKSVLLQHAIGLMEPDEGDVFVRGRRLGGLARSELFDLRLEIGVMFQDGALFSAMTVYDNCAFPLRQHTNLDEDTIHDLVQERLASVGLAAAANRLPNEISGGMKKRAGLARALMLEPRILLVDEPDSGLDPVRTALLGELLRQQHRENGGTIVIVTHNVALAKEVGDHLSVLWRGRVLESGMIDAVMAADTPFVRQFLAGDPQGPLTMDG